MDQYIGKLLDNRYEILELVGVGGMARVYKARCHRLNRLVAIKILREDLSEDSELRRRFHDESQAVAMLSHPNIVSVYDVSRSSELEYIVMELIDGITLKQYMQQKGDKLNWREALHFITQIVKALGHAHSRGIIHRDIKPHNIMVLKDGSVKVADFGIARLVSGGHSTLTQEALGSVHYISPEQARGSHVDARSDLYSAGVVLYEMITGRLPFEGDTPVSVAIQHINSIPLSPRELDPEIPEALEAITMKAMAPDPDNRYADADEMLEDLEEFRKNPSINFDYGVSEPLIAESDVEKTQIHATPVTALGSRQLDHEEEHTAVIRPRESRPRRYEDYDDYEEDVEEERPRKQKRTRPDRGDGGKKPSRRKRGDEESKFPVIAAVAGVLLFIGIVFFVLYHTVLSGVFNPPQEPVMVPDLIGRVYDEVKNDSKLLGPFKIVVQEEVADDSEPAGTILRQDPKPDTEVLPPEEDGSNDHSADSAFGDDSEPERDPYEITVVVSSGPEPMYMVDLTDLDYREAYVLLGDMGLTYSTDYEYDDEVEKNHIISYTPLKDTHVQKGDEVHLIISLGAKIETVEVPNVVEQTEAQAKSDITTRKLQMGTVDQVYHDIIPAGQVVYQYPAAGSKVEEGTKINLQVSKGKDPSTLPPPPKEPDTSVEPEPEPPKKVTKEIEVPLPTDGEKCKLSVMLDGVVIFEKEYDTAMEEKAVVSVTAPEGSSKTLLYFYNGVLGGQIKQEF